MTGKTLFASLATAVLLPYFSASAAYLESDTGSDSPAPVIVRPVEPRVRPRLPEVNEVQRLISRVEIGSPYRRGALSVFSLRLGAEDSEHSGIRNLDEMQEKESARRSGNSVNAHDVRRFLDRATDAGYETADTPGSGRKYRIYGAVSGAAIARDGETVHVILYPGYAIPKEPPDDGIRPMPVPYIEREPQLWR